MPSTLILKLDSVYGLVKTECDSTGGILSNMVTQGASQHLEQHLALDGQWVDESRSKDK